MTVSDGLMILAVLLGPVIAVQLTRYLDNQKESRARKLGVFKTLMSTRGSQLSIDHVQALNRIDLEFDRTKSKERDVIDAWKAYLDHLCETNLSPEQWGVRRVDLYVELLHKMAITLDYQFDKTHIKNSAYSPRLYGELEEFQTEMRKAMRELMSGHRPLPVFIMNVPVGAECQAPAKDAKVSPPSSQSVAL